MNHPLHALLVAALLGACSGPGRWPREAYELSYGPPPASTYTQVLTHRVHLLADNQRHDLLGHGVDLFRAPLSDELVSVSIRPPQLDYYGPHLFREALIDVGDRFVIHLGDACNVANTTEFARVAWDLRAATGGWVMIPGNHDGFFFGNSSRTRASLIEEWNDSAERWTDERGRIVEGRAMQKDRLVTLYLASQVLQGAPWSRPLAASLSESAVAAHDAWLARRDGARFEDYWFALIELEEILAVLDGAEHVPGSGRCAHCHAFELADSERPDGPHLRRLVWHVDRERPWRSYVVQEFDVADAARTGGPAISVIGLDSAQYGYQPSLDHGFLSAILTRFRTVQLAGLHGNVLESQMQCALEPVLASLEREGRPWVLASHHPFRDLGWASRPRVAALRDRGGIPLYLSAHSHFGTLRWHDDSDREGTWLEINTGSLLDPPLEHRDLQFLRDPTTGRLAAWSRRHELERSLIRRGLLVDERPGYRPSDEERDAFLSYRDDSLSLDGTKAEWTTKALLLAALRRAFSLFPTMAGPGPHWPWRAGTPLDTDAAVRAAIDDLQARLNRGDRSTTLLDELRSFLYELRRFDETRPIDPEHTAALHAFRISQAVWAGAAERRTKPRREFEVDPDLSFVQLPLRPAGR